MPSVGFRMRKYTFHPQFGKPTPRQENFDLEGNHRTGNNKQQVEYDTNSLDWTFLFFTVS